jgi:DUF4097 and DUF4098 domain-containing protein YvlB
MEDKRRILDMLAEKKITSEEALKLISALNEKKNEVGKPSRFFKITVHEDGKPKPKVKISIPIMLMKLGTKFIPKESMNAQINGSNIDLSSIDWDEVFKLASKGEVGDLFNADIEEDNGRMIRVRIFVE